MITPISPNYTTSFAGLRKKNSAPKNNSEAKNSHSMPKVVKYGMPIILTATMIPYLTGCTPNQTPDPDSYSTTNIGQMIAQREEASKIAEQIKESERASEAAFMEQIQEIEERNYQEQQRAMIERNGVDSYTGLDLSDEEKYNTYLDIKNTLKILKNEIGDNFTSKISHNCENYNINPVTLYALFTEEGGVPQISSLAKQDVIDKYPQAAQEDNLSQLTAYYSICLDRANYNTNNAMKLFTGKDIDVSAYEEMYRNLSPKTINAIANNDAWAAFQATHSED